MKTVHTRSIKVKSIKDIREGRDHYVDVDPKDMGKVHDAMGDAADDLEHEGDTMIVPNKLWKAFQKACKQVKCKYKEL